MEGEHNRIVPSHFCQPAQDGQEFVRVVRVFSPMDGRKQILAWFKLEALEQVAAFPFGAQGREHQRSDIHDVTHVHNGRAG